VIKFLVVKIIQALIGVQELRYILGRIDLINIMKKILYILYCLFILNIADAQTGIGTTTPDASAKLDVSSTSKGFLPPRMTSLQRTGISSPASGLMVYQTDGTAGLYYYGSSGWIYIINSTTNVVAVVNGGTGTTTSTGTGSVVLSTNPTLTSIITPVITGGTSTTQTLTFKPTSGNGITGADHIFQVGNNGGTEAMRILNNGNVGIGTSSPTVKLQVNGDIIANSIAGSSDLRFKTNIRPVTNVLDKIKALRGVYFNWNQNEYPEKQFGSNVELGFIAQEVEKIVPEIVTKDKTKEEYRSVKYDKLVALLVEAIKEQQKQIDSLTIKVNNLNQKNK
jgi:hypothetical protein